MGTFFSQMVYICQKAIFEIKAIRPDSLSQEMLNEKMLFFFDRFLDFSKKLKKLATVNNGAKQNKIEQRKTKKTKRSES